mgnify:CR=1 FL=1
MISRSLILCTAIATCVLGGACATGSLYKHTENRYDTFSETISSFLMTQDQKTLIVIGAKNHFFLNLTPKFKSILQHPARNRMQAEFDGLKIYRDQTIIGKYQVKINADQWQTLPYTQQMNLQQLGFEYSENSRSYILRDQLSGKRYSAGGFKLPPHLSTFNKPYHISVSYAYAPTGRIVEHILTTPLGLVGDSILVAGVIAVAPIASVYMFFNY